MTIRDIVMAAAGVEGAPPPASSTDPQFNYVTMLLHGDGTNGAQNNTFVDSSTNNFTITRNGTPTQGSFSPYGDLWSNYFGGSGSFIQASGSQNQNLLGNGDFTIEAWVFSSTSAFNQTIVTTTSLATGARGFGWNLRFEGGYNIRFYVGSGTSGSDNEFLLATSTGITINTWNHIAVVRNGATVYVYVNGVQKGSAAMPATYNLTGTVPCQIGQRGTSLTEPIIGNISNCRIVAGTALYTSNFTPSTTPLTAVSGTSLLTCQSNRFRDNSSNNFAITVTGTPSVQRFSPFDPAAQYSTSVVGGSGFFNGTSDYLTTSNGPTFSGDFTIEAWVYLTNLPTFSMLLGETDFPSYVGIKPTAIEVGFARSSNYPNWNFTFVRNTWYHLAISRQSGTVRCFLNGQQLTLSSGSATDTSTLSDGALAVGRYSYSPFYYFPGYISNLRIVNGTAVYTAAFTPPTAPLTAITNTSLLLNTVNAGIFDNAMMNDLVTVGNAQVSTAVKKYGTGSMAFDLIDDCLVAPSSTNFQYGAGDFTVEFWLYFASLPSLTAIIFDQRTAATQVVPTLYYDTNNLYYLTNGAVRISGAFTTAGAWVHVALCRSAGSTRLFVNGVQLGSTYTDANNYVASPVYVGARWDLQGELNGYIDDLRITKGYARYTANFTPPTAAFPNN